ncbi:MAG: alpha/beta hydrolase [Pseudomonadota bacterium]|nr:alpha/beta hydrolase [Pseudomonadota bacterium]
MTDRLPIADTHLAFEKLEGSGLGILFLHGLRSDMNGAKALALDTWCRKQGRALVRFDFRGHGQSGAQFTDCTLSTWIEDAMAVLDTLTAGPQIVVGSSMGGWVMLHLALRRPDRIEGLVGLAAAPDFTYDLLTGAMTDAQRQELDRAGIIHCPCDQGDPYPITKALIEDGNRLRVLDKPLGIPCSVRLLQGMQDRDVPWETALRLVQALESPDVRLILIKDGNHRLSRDQDIACLLDTVAGLL